MADDPQLREMTCDPKFRRVLITDGRTAVGQAMAKAFSDAGAISCSSASPIRGSRFPAQDALRKIENVEIVPLDVTDTEWSPSRPSRTAAASILSSTPPSTCAPGGVDAAAWADRGARRDGRALFRPDAARAGVRPGYARARRRRGQFGRGLRQSAVRACADELAGLRAYSAAEAACFSAAQCLRAELRPGGVKVLNVFFGPLETEWFQTVPPPKVAPAALAKRGGAGLAARVGRRFRRRHRRGHPRAARGQSQGARARIAG